MTISSKYGYLQMVDIYYNEKILPKREIILIKLNDNGIFYEEKEVMIHPKNKYNSFVNTANRIDSFFKATRYSK